MALSFSPFNSSFGTCRGRRLVGVSSLHGIFDIIVVPPLNGLEDLIIRQSGFLKKWPLFRKRGKQGKKG
jgi:hypothetical protein